MTTPRTIAAVLVVLVLGACARYVVVPVPGPYDVDGRGLQPAWWTALPSPEEFSEATTPPPPTVDAPPPAPDLPADALFEPGSAVVRPDAVEALSVFAAEVAEVVAAHGPWLVIGATDSTSDSASNHRLGLERAGAVIDVLIVHPDLDDGLFIVGSWGEDCPKVDETTADDLAEARSLNRRVVLVADPAQLACPLSS